jgi:hypothetical protein
MRFVLDCSVAISWCMPDVMTISPETGFFEKTRFLNL